MNAIINLEAGTATFTTDHFSTFVFANVFNENSVITEKYDSGLIILIIVIMIDILCVAIIVFLIYTKKKGAKERQG